MGIQFAYTNPSTGEVSLQAHLVLDDPIFRGEVQHVVVRGRIYASKTDFDNGMAPISRVEREYGEAEYTELREVTIPICETWVLRDNVVVSTLPTRLNLSTVRD